MTMRMGNKDKAILKDSVRLAREKLQQRALGIVEDFQATIEEARERGQYEFALKAQQWLIEHIADEDGLRIVDPSVDRMKVEEKQSMIPRFQIGIALGGVTPQLPAAPPTVSITEATIETDPVPATPKQKD